MMWEFLVNSNKVESFKDINSSVNAKVMHNCYKVDTALIPSTSTLGPFLASLTLFLAVMTAL